jgi:CRISPR/Cas system-associated endonuclease Cas1
MTDDIDKDNQSIQFKKLIEWKNSIKSVLYILGRYNLEVKNNKLEILKNNEVLTVPFDEIDRLIIIGKPRFNTDIYYPLMTKGINIEFYDYFSHPKGVFTQIIGKKIAHYLFRHKITLTLIFQKD